MVTIRIVYCCSCYCYNLYRKQLEVGKKRRLEEMDAADAQLMTADAEMIRLQEMVEALHMKVVIAEEQRRVASQVQEETAILQKEVVRLQNQRETDEQCHQEALATEKKKGNLLTQVQQEVLELR